jgi:SAM-dependent methyltransferase
MVDHVIEVISQRLRSSFTPSRALDFGCGVGRLAIPFAEHCVSVTGVDVSPGMSKEAAKNAANENIGNVQFLSADEFNSQDVARFDLIHSFIVFQHIRPYRGELIIQDLLRKLESGGAGVFHITFANTASEWINAGREFKKRSRLVHGLLNLVRGKSFVHPVMQMNSYSLNRMFGLLLKEGCGSIYTEFTNHAGFLGVMLYFQKVLPPAL